MTPEQEQLVAEALPTVEAAARRFLRGVTATSVDRESVRSAALEGLVDAATRFRGGPTWHAYLHLKVTGRMHDELRAQDPAKNRSTTPDRDRVTTRTVPLPTTYDRPHPTDAIAQARARLDLLDAIHQLPARQRHAVAELSIRDRRLKDVAHDLHVTESRACNIRREAFATLRDTLTPTPAR